MREVSVVITTYNRREALEATLKALAAQTVPPDDYEIVVVDDGSTDGTWKFLEECHLPYGLTRLRQPANAGISAARNRAIRAAVGGILVFVSDDLIVPREFLATHLHTLESFPGYWVVGGFRQLDSSTDTRFGRYLDTLEKGFEEGRKLRSLGPNLWEMSWPTARNLSVRRDEIERAGLFDEQFRNTCEDQDLTHRARAIGIGFLYNTEITCLYNDQSGDLKRYCEAQRRGARDTVRFCAKYPAEHGQTPIARLNGFLAPGDGICGIARKLLKSFLATPLMTVVLERVIGLAERTLDDASLHRCYRVLIGLYIFRGWREGLRQEGLRGLPTVAGLTNNLSLQG